MTLASWLSRTGPWNGVCFVALLTALCLMTFAILELPWRFEATGPAMMWDEAQSGAPLWRGWLTQGRADKSGRDGAIRLTAGAGSTIPAVGSPSIKPGFGGFVQVAAEVSAENLVPGRAAWETGHVLILSYDSRGQLLPFWPKELAILSADSGWHRREIVIPVAGEVGQLRLIAYNAAASGTMDIRAPSASALAERPGFAALRYALMLAWTALGAWGLVAMARARARPVLKLMMTTLALAIGTSALIPQPYFDQLTRPIQTWLSTFSGSRLATNVVPRADVDAGSALHRSQGQGKDSPSAVSGPRGGSPATKDGQQSPDDQPLATIVGTSGASPSSVDELPFTFEELVHFSGFALLAAFALLTFRSVSLLVSSPVLFLAGPATECLQLFLITRSFEWQDLAVDWAGIATGIFFAVILMIVHRSLGERSRVAGWPW